MRKTDAIAVTAVMIAFCGLPVQAQELSAGAREFRDACAFCHGTDATGRGPLAEYLSVPPADLTLLKQKNGGTYPFGAVLASIDGRAQVRTHGSDMPAWGDRFRSETQDGTGFAAEILAVGRMASIVQYLETIQK